jgi:chromosome segregation ATPase
MPTEIERIKNRAAAQKEELRVVSDTVIEIKEIVGGHTTSLAVLDQRTATMEAKIDSCDYEIARVGRYLDRVKSGLTTLDGRVSGLERAVVTQGEVLGRHGDVLGHHSDVLGHHTEVLGRHGELLEEILRRLEPRQG